MIIYLFNSISILYYIRFIIVFNMFSKYIMFENILNIFDTIQCNTPLYIDNGIHDHFKLPIQYLEDKYELKDNVIEDIELYNDNSNNVLHKIFQPNDVFDKTNMKQSKQYYTTNTEYLKDTQRIISNNEFTHNDNNDHIINLWKDVKQNSSFLQKYSYMDWKILSYLNHNTVFLSITAISNLMTPILFFLIPIIILIIPFLILKFKGHRISFNEYYLLLKVIGHNHFIGKLLNGINDYSLKSICTYCFYIGTFIYQIYCNINSCKRFYNNMKVVNENMCSLQKYTDVCINNMNHFEQLYNNTETYQPFINNMIIHKNVLIKLREEIYNIQPFCHSITKVTEFGDLLTCYYNIFDNKDYESTLCYSFGFTGYIHNIINITEMTNNGLLNFSTFNNDNETIIHKQKYALINDDIKDFEQSNTCSFNKNMIISGPNASGKTTLLKSTLINIILTQQYGCGFYKSCNIHPYSHIHSYLNIPDTSERDSLFQAESRRCKDIIETIDEYPEKDGYRHFCIFDELYSGTNPEEASRSGYAFLCYLEQHTHVNYMLTTHYLYICKKFKKSKVAQNYKMNAILDDTGNIVFEYKLKKGISKLRGAIHVLKNMNYPIKILENIKQL